jgi:CRP/FNR family transcriptional regulator, cyclic AMP receptor protein
MNAPMQITAIDQHPFARELQPQHMRRLAALARPVQFERDQVLFKEGDPRRDFFLVMSGHVAIEMSVPGRFLRVETVGPGEELGWSAVLEGATKHFQGRALDAATLLAFDGASLLKACDEDPSFGFELMRRMLGIVRTRLQFTRLQLSDTYSPVARKAGA